VGDQRKTAEVSNEWKRGEGLGTMYLWAGGYVLPASDKGATAYKREKEDLGPIQRKRDVEILGRHAKHIRWAVALGGKIKGKPSWSHIMIETKSEYLLKGRYFRYGLKEAGRDSITLEAEWTLMGTKKRSNRTGRHTQRLKTNGAFKLTGRRRGGGYEVTLRATQFNDLGASQTCNGESSCELQAGEIKERIDLIWYTCNVYAPDREVACGKIRGWVGSGNSDLNTYKVEGGGTLERQVRGLGTQGPTR